MTWGTKLTAVVLGAIVFAALSMMEGTEVKPKCKEKVQLLYELTPSTACEDNQRADVRETEKGFVVRCYCKE